jgi:hypothetical protein
MVSAVGNYSMRLADHALPIDQRREALKFLIHFVADLYQPLHVGFIGDKGGNKLKVIPPWDRLLTKKGKPVTSPRSHRLHYLWDSHIIQFYLDRSGKSWLTWAEELINDIQMTNPAVRHIGVAPLYHAISIASQTAILACDFAYRSNGHWIVNGESLDLQYYEKSAAVIEHQLMQAGIDIAETLNYITGGVVSPGKPFLSDSISQDGDSTEAYSAYGEGWDPAFFSDDDDESFHMFGP